MDVDTPNAAVTSIEEVRPFGLRFVTESVRSGEDALKMDAVQYDHDRQIMVMRSDGVMIPAFKHTNSKTSTSTNVDDRRAGDSDTDYEQDR